MKKEAEDTSLDRFSRDTVDKIISAFLGEDKHRDLILQTSIAALNKHNGDLANALTSYLRVRILEDEIDQHTKGVKELDDQGVRNVNNEISDIKKTIDIDEKLKRGYKYVGSIYATKLKPKSSGKITIKN